jgi:hypothetical protein
MTKPNDVGGHEAGNLDFSRQEASIWEKEVDAIHLLIADEKRNLRSIDESRAYIEKLGDELYNKLSYYERWTAVDCLLLVEKGILSQDEIDAKVREVRSRLAAEGEIAGDTP